MIRFRKLTEKAEIPFRASQGAAGFDLFTIDSFLLEPGKKAMFGTGIQMELDPGYWGCIKPRSGWAYKYGLDVLGGVIDSDYRGEIKVILINLGTFTVEVKEGDRIAQLIIIPHMSSFTVGEDFTDTDRGGHGFGSTGF